jgi:hypothetical protein
MGDAALCRPTDLKIALIGLPEESMLSTVLNRELDQEKSHDSSGSRIRCPLCGWSPRKDDK